jgi:hypothetical protein
MIRGITSYSANVRGSSRPLLGVQTSKPKRGCLSTSKGTREACPSRVIAQPNRRLSVQVFTDEVDGWRSRRSSLRLGKPTTWPRAAGCVVLDERKRSLIGRVLDERGRGPKKIVGSPSNIGSMKRNGLRQPATECRKISIIETVWRAG